jgi:hypothetical protein
MFNKTIVAFGIVAVIAGAALPALANTDLVFNVPQGSFDGINQLDTAQDSIAQVLHQRGYKVTDVGQWAGYIRADVVLANGERAVRFFDRDTLQQVDVHNLTRPF